MHLDLQTQAVGPRISDEFCIIGAGAAGITLARFLLAQGRSVTLLESGGLDYEAPIAALNDGENVGEPYYDLVDARLRFFGGTTAIWGGRLAELDPIDLQKRRWVPGSGWPIAWSELQRFYEPARATFGDAPPFPVADEIPAIRTPAGLFDPSRLEVGLWTFDRKFNRFIYEACRDIVQHPQCRTITHATVTELITGSDGARVVSARVKSLAGRTVTVEADTFVLAAGGLENPRLLLASRSQHPAGLGNAHDQVGRYFMEHPHARGGKLVGAKAWPILRAFTKKHHVGDKQVSALIKGARALQEREEILNTALTIVPRKPPQNDLGLTMRAYSRIKHSVAPTQTGRALWMSTKRLSRAVQRVSDPLRPWLLHRLAGRDLAISVRAEQAPNPRSRVRLTDRADALGMPRIALDWRLTEQDVRTVRVLVETLDAELSRSGLGRVDPAGWLRESSGWRTDPLIGAHSIGGYHHMGTTRMSERPEDGVVDGDLKVHSIANLYVVGSSVFPTSGWANPTLTIVALALRLGERLSRIRQRRVAA